MTTRSCVVVVVWLQWLICCGVCVGYGSVVVVLVLWCSSSGCFVVVVLVIVVVMILLVEVVAEVVVAIIQVNMTALEISVIKLKDTN